MIDTTKEELEKWYIEEKLSTRQIAEKLDTSQPTARKLMKSFGIEMRTYKENKTPYKKGDKFSEEHKAKIAEALKGNTNWLDKATGKHFNFQREEVQCTRCKKLVEKKKCHLAQYEPFCNKDCHNKWKSETIIGKNHHNYRSETVPCTWCGNEVVRKASELERSENFFCDVICNGAWKSANLVGEKCYNYKGGHDDYRGPNWLQQRKKARERDKHTCQRCFKTAEELGRNLDVHHIKPFREFGLKNYEIANALDNLISYCNSCHKIVETETENE